MTEDKGNIEKMLQDNLKGRKVAVPDFVWGNVEKEISEKKKRRGFFWLWGGGLTALLFLGGYVLWSNNGFTNSDVACYFPIGESANNTYLFNKYVGDENEYLTAQFVTENETDWDISPEEELSASTEYAENNNENIEREAQTHEGLHYNNPDLNSLLSHQQNNAANLQQDESNTNIADDAEVSNDDLADEINMVSNNSNLNANSANSQEVAADNDSDDSDENNVIDQSNLDRVNDSSSTDNNEDGSAETDNGNKPDKDLNNVDAAMQSDVENNLAKTIGDSLNQLKKEHEMSLLVEQMDMDSLSQITDSFPEKDSIEIVEANKDSVTSNPITELLPDPPAKKWIVGLQGGYSAYDIAVFNEVFHSGVLSNRFFEANGFDLNVHLNYEMFNRFQLFGSLNYNEKSTFFNYAVRTDDQGYNEHIVLGNPLPLPEINDSDEESNCYLIEDVIANYTIQTVFFDLGFQYNFIQRPKFTLGAGLFIGGDLVSNLRLNEASILDVANTSTNFSTLKYGLGLDANYWLTDRFALSLAPKFQFLSSPSDHAFYVGPVKEWITNMGLKYKF